jgi:hypothetical protein
MLPMWRVVIVFFLSGLMVNLLGQEAPQAKSNMVRVRARIVEQKYCRADADLFTVSLKLDVEVFNSSKTSVGLPPNMIPWVARVAASAKDAESGHYLYEVTRSHYLLDSGPAESLRIEPEKATTLHTGYDLVAKYDPAFAYPKTIAPGSYGIVLVLRPETDLPSQGRSAQAIDSLTTEPFMITVPQHPKVVDCEESPKPRSRQ